MRREGGGPTRPSPQHSPVSVPDVPPKLKPPFCRLQGQGVSAGAADLESGVAAVAAEARGGRLPELAEDAVRHIFFITRKPRIE